MCTNIQTQRCARGLLCIRPELKQKRATRMVNLRIKWLILTTECGCGCVAVPCRASCAAMISTASTAVLLLLCLCASLCLLFSGERDITVLGISYFRISYFVF